jgi:hypothetical protein
LRITASSRYSRSGKAAPSREIVNVVEGFDLERVGGA